MADLAPMIQKLRKLGLTRTEAEAYLAAIQETTGGPVSAYRIAQSIGRDPANLGKTLTALEKHGAVRVIQEKPRLYLPVAPEEFTKGILVGMQETGTDLVDMLAQLAPPSATGLNLALKDNQQALDQAALLLRQCKNEVLISASPDALKYLGTEFGNLARKSQCVVKFLGPEDSGITAAQDLICPLPMGFPEDGPHSWLYLIVDRKAWLAAWFNRTDDPELPCGWWSDDPGLATIMGAVMDAAFQPADQGPSAEDEAIMEPDPKTAPEFSSGLEINSPPAQQVPETVPEKPSPEKSPESEGETPDPTQLEPEQESPAPQSQGLQFVVRHDDEEDRD